MYIHIHNIRKVQENINLQLTRSFNPEYIQESSQDQVDSPALEGSTLSTPSQTQDRSYIDTPSLAHE